MQTAVRTKTAKIKVKTGINLAKSRVYFRLILEKVIN